MANLERIYTIPLGDMYEIVRMKRGKRSITFIRDFALRHMKAADTKISEGVNSAILRDGIEKPPRRIKVRIVKDENGTAKVWLIGEEEKLKEAAEKGKKQEEEAKKKQEEASKKKSEAQKSEAKAATAASLAKAPAATQAKPAPTQPMAAAPAAKPSAPATASKPAAPAAQAKK